MKLRAKCIGDYPVVLFKYLFISSILFTNLKDLTAFEKNEFPQGEFYRTDNIISVILQ